jgi:hypothetical protein
MGGTIGKRGSPLVVGGGPTANAEIHSAAQFSEAYERYGVLPGEDKVPERIRCREPFQSPD